jgi:purine-binding chemotaxis protein CheW
VSVDELKGDRIVQMAAFRVGSEDYVIDIMRIKEIINPQRITPVHDDTGLLEGVINLRGSIIPVIDLRRRFGLSRSENQKASKIIIAVIDERVVGFWVDEVLDVIRIPRSHIKPPPALGDNMEPGMILGVCQSGERLLLLLNLKKVLTPSFFRDDSEEIPAEGED